MEHSLTCNNLKCRKELGDRALVTTCSHIFCLDCVHDLGIAKQDGPRGTACPACNAQLSKPDDAVIANLNPSEDYKTSVLSGLSPNVVMECAGRALSFWAYQTTQEIYYQQYLYKTLTEKYSSLNLRLEQTVGDANAEIERLQNKVNACEAESEIMRRKHEELAHAYKDKSRKLLQTQELYDRVKRRVEMGQIERAASDAVDSSLNAPPRESAHRQRHGPAPELDVAAPDSYDNRIDMCSFGRGVPAATSQATADSTGWPGAGIPLQPGMFYASGGLDARHRFGLASQLGNRSHETRETAAPLVMGSRRGIIPSTSDLCQGRGSLSGVGLSSGLKVSQPANITGLGASVRLQQ